VYWVLTSWPYADEWNRTILGEQHYINIVDTHKLSIHTLPLLQPQKISLQLMIRKDSTVVL
jgi:hypothetical protein